MAESGDKIRLTQVEVKLTVSELEQLKSAAYQEGFRYGKGVATGQYVTKILRDALYEGDN